MSTQRIPNYMATPSQSIEGFAFDLQRFAVTDTFEDGVYTLTTDEGTLKLSGLRDISKYKPTFNETDNLVDVRNDAVAEGGILTVVENSAGYDIRLWGKNFTLVGSSGDDGFIFGNVEPNITIKYTVGNGGNDRISSEADIAMTTVKLQFVTNENKPVAYSTKWSGNNLIVTVGDNTITYVNFGAGNVSVDNGVGLETIDGLNVNVDETGNGYYEISSASDLQTLANYVNSGGYTSGKVFKLTGDIDLSGSDFAGIGNGNNNRGFSGTFDGNGFTIRNLTINGGTNSYVGLFGSLGSGGTIQNVKLDNVNVSGGNYYVGGLVGSNEGGKISNCTVTNATVSGTTNVGGLIGYNDHPDSSVTNNTFDGTVSGNRIVGSLVGNMAQGTLTGNNYHGNAGDVGYNDKGTVSNTRLYSVAVSGATFTVDSDPITIGTNTYYASGSTVTVEGQTFALGSDLSLAKVTYLGTDGTKSEVVHVLTGNETSLSAGTYIINDNITLNALSLGGNVNLILADGKTLTVDNNISGGNLTVFGQSGGTGKLNVTGTISSNTLNFTGGNLTAGTVSSNTLNFKGGNLTADTVSSNTLNFKGGNLTADTISSSVTLDWTQDTDTFSATNFNGSLTIADGKRFYDAANKIFSGTLTDKPNGQLRVLDGVRLDLPSGVTVASGKYTQVGSDIYVKAGTSITLKFADGLNPTKYRVNGALISDAPNNQYTFTMGDDITSVSADQYTFSVSGDTWSCKDGDNVIFTLSGVQNLKSSIISGNVVTLNADNFTGDNVTVSNLAGDFVFDIPDSKTFGGLGRLTDNGFSYNFKYTLDGDSVVYAINSVEDLQALATYANSADNRISTITAGKVFKLTADIDLSGVDNWTPIGDTGNTSFHGTFDGGGHVISNLTCTGNSRNGLFGTVNTNGVIKNVTLINANVSGGSNNGALVGYNAGNVTNCTVIDATINGTRAGALVGWNTGNVSGNKYQSNVGDVGWSAAGTVNNTRLYTFTTTSGVTAEYTGDNDHKFTFDGKDYYASGATFKLTVDADNFPQYYKIRSVSGATANDDGTYTATINGDLTVQVYGYPKIAGLAFDSDTNKYTVDSTADFLMLASYVSGGGDISGLEFDFTATEYTINDLNELRALADYVNGGGDTSGLTFKLAQSIGGVNFHIGDSNAHKFKGTLDGNGYTISVKYNVTEKYCALFNYVDGATIQKLTVDGTINTSEQCAAGIAAYVDGTTNITDCRSSVTINSTFSGVAAHGGLVATVANTSATLNLTNCIFDGKLLGSQSKSCGGLVGGLNKTSTANVTNCLFAPSEVTLLNAYNDTLISGSGTVNLNGGYYTQALTNAQGTQVYKSLTLPEGVEATATDENTVTFGNTTYYVSGAAVTLKVTEQPDGKFLKGATRNDDGTYTATIGTTVAEWADIPTIEGLTFDNAIGAFKIATLADLQTLATYISNGSDTADLTFKLTADISGVDFVIGTFKGTLDGDGHKITLNHTASTADCALFSELNNATIKNLHVDGTINTSKQFAAGFAIKTTGTTTITDCRSSVEINGTASGYAYYGGFVRLLDSGTLNVTNCIFDGKFSSTNPTKAVCIGIGQIATSSTLNLSNCLVAPQALIDNPHNRSSTFYGVDGSTGSGGDNNYYTQVINSVSGGKQVYAVTLPEGVAASGAVFVVDNTAYAPAGAQLTFAGKTGYIFSGESLTVMGNANVTGTVTFDTENHYVLADDTTKLADTANTATYPELIQVYELTLPSGVTADGDICITDGDKIYAAGNVTFTGVKTGYVINPINVTADTIVNAELDTANHYVFADGNGYTIATADNVAAYPELIQVYELTLPEGVTVNGGTYAVDNGVTYAVGNVTFDAGTGAAVKPVTVNTDTNISAADIYYTVTIPAEMEIVNNSLNDGDIYTGDNGTTYYKRGAKLTLKLKDGYPAAAIQNGGDTLDVEADGTYGLTVSGVTTITGSDISWRDPPMSTTKTFSITGLADAAIEFSVDENNNVTSTDTFFTDKTVSEWFGYDGTNIVVKQEAVDLIANGGTLTSTNGNFVVDSAGVTIDGVIYTSSELKTIDDKWAYDSATSTVTYYNGKSGYTIAKNGRTGNSYKFTVTSAAKFTISGTFPSDIATATATDFSNYFSISSGNNTYTVTVNNAFVSKLNTGTTLKLIPKGNTTSATFDCAVTSPTINGTESNGDYTCSLSAYGTAGGSSITLHPSANAFTINKLASGLVIVNGNIYKKSNNDNHDYSNDISLGTVAVGDDNKVTITLISDDALDQSNTASFTSTDYTAEFVLNGPPTYSSSNTSVTGTVDSFTFTAGTDNPGFVLGADNATVSYVAGSGSGGEIITISGLSGLSGFSVNSSGVITATKNSEKVTVGTITKSSNGGFVINLGSDVVPDSGTINVTSDVSVELTGIPMSKNEGLSVTKVERTPPPNQLRRCISNGGLYRKYRQKNLHLSS